MLTRTRFAWPSTLPPLVSAKEDWGCNIGIVALWAAASLNTLTIAEAQCELASLLDIADLRAPWVRTLAMVGTFARGPRASGFIALRAQIVIEGALGG